MFVQVPFVFNASHPLAALSRVRGHTFSTGTSTPLYAESISGLDEYRFPPLDDVKDITIAHPQPQILRGRASMPQLSYPLAPRVQETGIPLEQSGWFGSGELGAVWEGVGSVTEGEMEPELEYPQ
jgi:hypothetical protein